jgi:serine/threonine protein kinase
MPNVLAFQGGDLRNVLSRELHNGTHEFDWYNKGKDVALAVARGLNFLHNNNVVHR